MFAKPNDDGPHGPDNFLVYMELLIQLYALRLLTVLLFDKRLLIQ